MVQDDSVRNHGKSVLFMFQVVLPFVEKYFRAHREYFVGGPNAPNTSSMASVKEKEMTAR